MKITKTQADELVEKYPNLYKKEIKIKDRTVWLYNYILADYDMFQEDELSREMRGLVITDEPQKIFLSVPKFFNINEIPETQEQLLKTKTIKKVQDKLDGSLITPILLNGDIVMKSKASFQSDQSRMAQEALDQDPDLQYFILDMFANKFQPFFELVGPDNPHVIEYEKNEIVLIMVRDEDGHFIDIDKFNYPKSAKSETMTIDDMLKHQQTAKGIEGWVVKFTDGSIIKVKTKEFFELHKIYNEADSYKVVLKRILDEDMDDILSIVSPAKRERLLKYNKAVADYVVSFVKEIENILKPEMTRKELAQKYKEHLWFSVIMAGASGKDVKTTLIDRMKSRYSKESPARVFINSLL